MTEKSDQLVLVLSGPSGSGKSTISKALEAYGFGRVLRYTTKPHCESDTDSYEFVSETRFDEILNSNALIEYSTFKIGRYGTRRSHISAALEHNGRAVIEVDTETALKLKEILSYEGYQVVDIFLSPVSRVYLSANHTEELTTVLQRRIKKRSRGETKANILARVFQRAQTMVAQASNFSFVVENLDGCQEEALRDILRAISAYNTPD
jgi:guanylate kinase